MSERRACKVLERPRSTQRHEPLVQDDEQALTNDIVGLATRFGRCGYRRVTALLRDAGWLVNHKRVERIWRREGLEGAGQAAQKGTAVAERRVHHPAEAGEEKPRMGLGLRPHQDPGLASGAVVDCHR